MPYRSKRNKKSAKVINSYGSMLNLVHPAGFDSGAVREHRRPQVEKRKATTHKESTPIARWGARSARQIKKRCQNGCFETAWIYLSGSGFRKYFF
jgi:hypothetical protein